MALSPDGIDFTAQGSGVVFLETDKELVRVLKVYFSSVSEETTEYGFAVTGFDYSEYLRLGAMFRAGDFDTGPTRTKMVTADQRLMKDLVDYSEGGYGKPGIFYIRIEEEVTWSFSPHLIEKYGTFSGAA